MQLKYHIWSITISTYMNLRFLSSKSEDMTESSTFCTHAPCNHKSPQLIVHITIPNFAEKINNNKLKKKRETDPNGVVGPNVVLIDGLEPANIVVGVRYQVHVYFVWYYPLRRIVLYVLWFHNPNRRHQKGEYHGRIAHRCCYHFCTWFWVYIYCEFCFLVYELSNCGVQGKAQEKGPTWIINCLSQRKILLWMYRPEWISFHKSWK